MRKVAEDYLQLEVKAKREKVSFSASVIVERCNEGGPLVIAEGSGNCIKKVELKSCVASLHNPPRQGHMSWSFQPESAEIWATALLQLPEAVLNVFSKCCS